MINIHYTSKWPIETVDHRKYDHCIRRAGEMAKAAQVKLELEEGL